MYPDESINSDLLELGPEYPLDECLSAQLKEDLIKAGILDATDLLEFDELPL